MKGFLRVLIGLISAGLAVLVFELLLRVAGYMPEYILKIKTLYSDSGKLHLVLDTHLLYRIKPRSQSDINNYGYRDYDFEKKEPGTKRILFLGDSFIMSNNLSADETVPKLLEAKLGRGFEVFNMGVSGYGPDQEYLALLDHGLKLDPDLVILSIFAGNDFRDLELNGLFDLDKNGELQPTGTNMVKEALPATRLQMLLKMVLQHRYLDPESEDKIAAAFVQDKTEILNDLQNPKNQKRAALMRGVLRAFKKALAERHVRFMVIVLPSYEAFVSGSFINEKTAAELCQAEEIPVMDFAETIQNAGGLGLYDPVYQHLNQKGTEVVSDKTFSWLKREGE